MGQQNSSVIEAGNQEHQRLGTIRVYEAPDFLNEYESQYRIQLKRTVESQKKFDKWLAELREIDTEDARNVLYLPLSFKYEKTGLCGSSGHVMLTFQHFPYVLKSQVKNRRKMNQFFQESQLWYLAYNLIEAGTIFERKNKKLGDIHPNNCLLNQNGQFKIIALCSLPDQTTNYDKIIESPTNDAFLAPQEIDQTFLERGIYPNVDVQKAQVYSIGMTLLQAATLEDCFYAYNRGPYKVNKRKLDEYLKIVKQKYGKGFNDILNHMLCQLPKRRNKCSELFAELYPYEQAILELRPFSLTGDLQNSISGRTISNNGLVDQSTVRGQKFNNNPNTSILNTNHYLPTNVINGNQTGNGSNQTINFSHTGTRNQNTYQKGGLSSTSINNGFKR